MSDAHSAHFYGVSFLSRYVTSIWLYWLIGMIAPNKSGVVERHKHVSDSFQGYSVVHNSYILNIGLLTWSSNWGPLSFRFFNPTFNILPSNLVKINGWDRPVSQDKYNRETEIAKQNGRAIYSQIQKVTPLEIISRPQLYFSSRPRIAIKPGRQCQDQLQWLWNSCPGTDQSVETMTLKDRTWKPDEYLLKSSLRHPPRFLPAWER